MKKLYSNFLLAACTRYMLLFFCSIFCMGILSNAQPQISFNSIAQNLAKPVSVANAGDGSGRLFIVEQDGLIKIFKNGNVLSKPFLDISSLIKSAREYKGLFSIAFPADYNITRAFFVFYTNKEGASVLARFKVSKANPDSAILSSAVEVLSFSSTVGNGPHFGDLQFGGDGYLYVMLSDVSKPGVPNDFAQDGQSLLGKILRINVHVANAPYYKIPQDNPFVNNPSIRDEIWSLGIRNAWHWSFDRQTGDSWIADVGEDNWEEVNFTSPAQAKGANYGWHCFEGNDNYNTSGCGDRSNYVFPVFAYPHNTTNGGFAVIGGYVYRGNAYPALNGYYICADYTTGNAWKMKPNASGSVDVSMQNDAPKTLTGFGESEDGELYAVSLSGNLYRVQSGSSVTAAMQDDAIAANKNMQSFVYPTLVDNSTVTLDLKEVYQTARLMDMQGHEIMRKTLNGQTGKVTMNFPRLQAGMYIVQLNGASTMQQKIYVTK